MKIRLFIFAALVSALAAAALAADDPFVGTWMLNLDKTKMVHMPQKGTVWIEAVDNGLKVVADTIQADGKATHSESTQIFDGKDYPDPDNPGSVLACTRMDSNSCVCVRKKDAKEEDRFYNAISKDGKTGILVFLGKDGRGKDRISIRISDKK